MHVLLTWSPDMPLVERWCLCFFLLNLGAHWPIVERTLLLRVDHITGGPVGSPGTLTLGTQPPPWEQG